MFIVLFLTLKDTAMTDRCGTTFKATLKTCVWSEAQKEHNMLYFRSKSISSM